MSGGGPKSFRELIALWPTHQELAADLGINTEAIELDFYEENFIPRVYWRQLIRGAVIRGFHKVTWQALNDLESGLNG